MRLNPLDIQLIGDELAIRWSDGAESHIRLETVRRSCPCASCKGEPDALGRVDVPEVTYDPARSFRLASFGYVGGYAWQPTWGDGHSSGLYTFPLLRSLDQPAAAEEPKA